ncbi:hypothetical protein JCM1840_002122 [Sporobolomyces johnsonii]
MPDHLSITFLGTAAGRPSLTRNVSALVVKLDSKLWVFDAGEGTQHQFMDPRCKLPMSKVQRIFVTHMHGDHINGLPGLLCTISAGEGSVLPGQEDPRLKESQTIPPTQIYGPSGLRLFLRTCLALTHSVLTRPYVVHELLWPDEEPEDSNVKLHPSEREGRNIWPGEDGFWRDVVGEEEGGGVRVSAGPILHTVRCLGYLLTESPRPLPIQPSLYVPHLKNPTNAAALSQQGIKNPMKLLSQLQTERKPIALADGTVLQPPGMGPKGRRVVILGDTYDAEGMLPLVSAGQDEDPVDVVVHESTNAYLPALDESQAPGKLRGDGTPITLETVTQIAREHGHSTPQVAGAFARKARATRLVMNHLSVKYPDVADEPEEGESESRGTWRAMLREIERQAAVEMLGSEDEAERDQGREKGERKVRVASDFMEIDVPRRDKVKQGK